MTDSRLPGLHRDTPAERRRRAAGARGWAPEALEALASGLSPDEVDFLIEDVLGTFPLPLAVAPNLRVNGRDHLVPLAIEETSVVAGLALGAKLLREGPGVLASVSEPLAVAQVLLDAVPDLERARAAVLAREDEVLARADRGHERLHRAGGGARRVELREVALADGTRVLAVHLVVCVGDALGANLVSVMAEAAAPLLEAITGGRVLAAVVSNREEERLAEAQGRVEPAALGVDGAGVAARIERLSRVAEADPWRAITHNKGILNGTDGLLLATGQDFRAFDAAGHAFAGRDGQVRPLSTWRLEEGGLVGRIRLPVPLGTLGGAVNVHPVARRCLDLLGVDGVRELAGVVAAVGLAQNLAALRMLVTGRLTGGHLRLHAGNLARAAGATAAEVNAVVAGLLAAGEYTLTRAHEVLDAVRHR
jgi:hydroxymethylglutaryl-CoA reductase